MASPKLRRTSSILSVVKSVLASFLGVQSQKKYEEDFAEPSPLPFIITGVVLVLLFVLSLILLVNLLN
ncbi:DUF2970 domain-containing protein [Glaciecola sp. MH2013]|uniref:DUF2970 domain-containing protein n=1 Tax=Glaciecola sp. MH2013 TaxID=2785524 RepID=UPI00189C8349|nr:DUF2970 domain-containing protein [Glaciecola sp. MH2013]MBF7073767.1 DUF2970 domain-containing protein [Glaciecola sp. MH2013]